jgi:hypothetical protein
MNRSQVVAVASSLFLAAVLSIPSAGCGGDDVLLEGSGGSGGTGGSSGGGGTGGAPTSDAKADAPDSKADTAAPDGAADSNVVDAAGDSAARDGAIDALRADAEAGTADAARDAGAADVAPDRNTVDAGRDVTTADARPDSPPPIDASADAGPDVSIGPDAGPDTSVENDAAAGSDAAGEANVEGPDAGGIDAGGIEAAAPEAGGDGAVAGCDQSNTAACLTSRRPACFQCAQENECLTVPTPSNMGLAGTCEDVPGTAPAACTSVFGGSTTPSASQVCLATLSNIFGSGCAADGQETPCLCGATDPVACQSGGVTPAGPIYPIYACEFGTASANITRLFTDPTLGAGMADAIVQCLGAFGCDCF